MFLKMVYNIYVIVNKEEINMFNIKWEIAVQIEELIILSDEINEQLLIINTDTEEMRFYTHNIFGVQNECIIEFLETLKIDKEVIEKYKQSEFYHKVQELNGATKKVKYYIHLYDYEEGTAIFESNFFETEQEALDFAKYCNFNVSQNINVELMNADFYNEECEYTYFNRDLEPFEYGRI